MSIVYSAQNGIFYKNFFGKITNQILKSFKSGSKYSNSHAVTSPRVGIDGEAPILETAIALAAAATRSASAHSIPPATAETKKLPLYGAGCSEKLAYYIDNGTIASMILPNEFSMGYQSLTDLAAKLRNRMMVLEDREQDFNVVHQDNLFRDENQRILFPIVQ